MTSRNPFVVIKAVCAPRRSISALVASVGAVDDLGDLVQGDIGAGANRFYPL